MTLKPLGQPPSSFLGDPDSLAPTSCRHHPPLSLQGLIQIEYVEALIQVLIHLFVHSLTHSFSHLQLPWYRAAQRLPYRELTVLSLEADGKSLISRLLLPQSSPIPVSLVPSSLVPFCSGLILHSLFCNSQASSALGLQHGLQTPAMRKSPLMPAWRLIPGEYFFIFLRVPPPQAFPIPCWLSFLSNSLSLCRHASSAGATLVLTATAKHP